MIYTMCQLRYRHIFLKIIEKDFVKSKTNSNKKGWMKNEPKITTQKRIKMESQNIIRKLQNKKVRFQSARMP